MPIWRPWTSHARQAHAGRRWEVSVSDEVPEGRGAFCGHHALYVHAYIERKPRGERRWRARMAALVVVALLALSNKEVAQHIGLDAACLFFSQGAKPVPIGLAFEA